ncbi:hypothetical protein LO749_16870 [Paracoccus denitrificans]|uniref:hypothetical protein n=1 Tax=Paracoccus denitrificans TaxID=266 RepID=UPI001E34DDE3|nr:hypothetical protein [Paracoccus denitrificans]UFS64879.1 hypothetical protein LO749_12115 [Paracoccus denitrificans]UFS67764.1 hypothetical protein LO749_16870 [Paracoccus denitrificans]
MSDDLIAEAITEHWGPRCRTKDTDDFPELADQGGKGRCACCAAWEQYDGLRAEVERLTAALSDERAHADAMAEALKEIADLPAGNAHAVGTAKRARHIAICARRQG